MFANIQACNRLGSHFRWCDCIMGIRYYSTQSTQGISKKIIELELRKATKFKSIPRALRLYKRTRDCGRDFSVYQYGELAKLLCTSNDKMLMAPLVLDLLRVLKTKDGDGPPDDSSYKNPSVVEPIVQYLTSQPDQFIRAASLELLSESEIPVQWRIQMHLAAKELDAAYSIYQEYRYNDKFLSIAPTTEMVTEFTRSGFYNEALTVINDTGMPVSLVTWMELLTTATNKHDYEIVRSIWEHCGWNLSNFPINVVKNLALLAIEYSDQLMVERLTDQLVVRLGYLPMDIAGRLIHMFLELNNRPPVDIFKKVLEIQPETRLKHIPFGFTVGTAGSTALDDHEPHVKTLMMNYIIRTARTQKSPTFALQQYRILRNSGCDPDCTTLEELVFAAFRLGNSKKLGYEIFNELNIEKPTRVTFETLIRISLTGSKYDAVLYWLRLMRQHKVKLRSHIHNNLRNRFRQNRDDRYEAIIKDVSLLEQYDFPDDEALQRSSSRSKNAVHYDAYKDLHNCTDFAQGWNEKYVLS